LSGGRLPDELIMPLLPIEPGDSNLVQLVNLRTYFSDQNQLHPQRASPLLNDQQQS